MLRRVAVPECRFKCQIFLCASAVLRLRICCGVLSFHYHIHDDNNGIQLVTKVKNNMKNSLMTVADKIMLRKRAVVESVNDELKNIAQIEHSRHRSFTNFITNALSAIAAYCFFPKKPSISLEFITDNQLTLF